MISKEIIEQAKLTYQEGMRIRLMRVDDTQAPPVGTEGTVLGVDDIGSVIVSWDTGSSLNIILDEDEIEVINRNK